MENYLFFISKGLNVKIYSFVLMPNHFHLILRCPDQNLSESMNYFMRETSRQLAKEAGRINQVYGGRFHRSMIESENYFNHAYKYVYRNPIRAKLSQRAEEYPYSTLSGLLGSRHLGIPVEPDDLLFRSSLKESTLSWINSDPDPEHDELIRRGLKKSKFAIALTKNSREPSPLEKIAFY